MDFDRVVSSRRSIRSFKTSRVSWKLILEAIDAANQAPFADNRNHLRFLIVEELETIEKIAKSAHQTWINESNIIIVVCSNDKNLEAMHGERGRIYSRQQSGAAIENLLLKLTDLGLAGCWIGSFDSDNIRRALKIPKEIQIEAIIPVGYPKIKLAKKKKKSLENTIYWEEWDKSRRPTLFEESHREDR